MNRDELQRLSKHELVEYCLALQSKPVPPRKTSRTSSLPPSMDKKARRENSKPGGAKPGHEAKFRLLSDNPDEIVDHRPDACRACGQIFDPSNSADIVGTYEHIDIPPIAPQIVHHRRLACACSCGTVTKAPLPDAAIGSPFGSGISALALYMKNFQLCSYQRLQGMFADVFGLKISQGGIMNMLRRSSDQFTDQHAVILLDLRQAQCVASDETGMRIAGTNGQQWVFVSNNAMVHHADYTRKASVIDDIMDGHRPQFWVSDRYAAQQNHADNHQTCLAHLARDIARVLEVGDERIGLRLKIWIGDVFALANSIGSLAKSTIASKVRALEKRIDDILLWRGPCQETWAVVRKFINARHQLLTFVQAPDLVDETNNISERHLRPAVIQRKVTNGFRSKRSADDDCMVRTVVDTAKLTGKTPYQTIRATLAC